MQTKRRFATATVTVAAFLFGFLAIAGGAWAHCDTTQGPVVADARIALDRGDITPVLKWLKPDSETEVRAAFQHALEVRALSPEAQHLADRYFFETLVRVHRAGEGAPYTGLKDVAPEAIIQASDKALASASVDELVQTVTAVEGDSSLATATLSSKAGDSLADTLTYICTPEGIRRGDSVYGGSDTYTNVFKEGVEVPPADLLAPGFRWSYTLEEDAYGAVTEITRSSEVSGTQMVEIGGQSFEALVIDYVQGGRTGQQIWAKGVGVYSYGESAGLTLERFTPGAP